MRKHVQYTLRVLKGLNIFQNNLLDKEFSVGGCVFHLFFFSLN